MYNFYGGFRGRDFVFKTIYSNYEDMLNYGVSDLDFGEFCLINYFWSKELNSEKFTQDNYEANIEKSNGTEEYHNTLWIRVEGDEPFKRTFSFEPLAANILGEVPETLQLIINGGTSTDNMFNPSPSYETEVFYDGGSLEDL